MIDMGSTIMIIGMIVTFEVNFNRLFPLTLH